MTRPPHLRTPAALTPKASSHSQHAAAMRSGRRYHTARRFGFARSLTAGGTLSRSKRRSKRKAGSNLALPVDPTGTVLGPAQHAWKGPPRWWLPDWVPCWVAGTEVPECLHSGPAVIRGEESRRPIPVRRHLTGHRGVGWAVVFLAVAPLIPAVRSCMEALVAYPS